MTVRTFLASSKYSIGDLQKILKNNSIGLFFQLTDEHIKSIARYEAELKERRRDILDRMKELRALVAAEKMKSTRSNMKKQIRQLNLEFGKVENDAIQGRNKSKSTGKSKPSSLNPNQYKYRYIRVVSTPMG